MERLTRCVGFRNGKPIYSTNIDMRSMGAADKLKNALGAYEDKQEQGLLKILPCGIGTDIYIIPSETNFRLNLLHGHGELNRVYHQKVYSITFTNNGWYMEGDKEHEYGIYRLLLDRFFKVTWFLTEAEAEEALAKMGVSHGTE